MDALYKTLPHDKEHIDGYYKKLGQFYNSLSEGEKKVFHHNAQQAKVNSPDVAALFNDPAQKAELESYLKDKAGITDVPEGMDYMDSAFF
jgi:hypothetical protein